MAPADAPPEVKDVIEAGNEIAKKPYKYGGGHAKQSDSGYDCSGSISYALRKAGLMKGSMASGALMRFGERGRGAVDHHLRELAATPTWSWRACASTPARRKQRGTRWSRAALVARVPRAASRGLLARGSTLEGSMRSDPLAGFTPQVRDWFTRSFEEPTEAQHQAWPAIAGGEHVIVSAPTGSGKTLAAFLWGLDRLVAEPPDGEEARGSSTSRRSRPSPTTWRRTCARR